MAPELVSGEGGGDARSDLFAAGAILFEMLAGRPAFQGRNVVDVMRATMSDQPPALGGSPAVAAIDRVIRRALAKRAEDRFESADVMAEELRAAAGLDTETTTTARAQAMTRLVVLPFRILRPDAETDFLAFSLADAITTTLSGIDSLVVRSSAVAGRFLVEAPDLKALASEADVDRVVMGTLMRSGDQVRAVAHLIEAPNGRLIASNTVTADLGDLFRLQDNISRRVAEALSLKLTGSPASSHDSPQNPEAYELYLRANELARTYDGLGQARAALPGISGPRSRLRAGVGASGPVPPRHRQVRRRRARQREPRAGGLRSRARAQPRAHDRAQVLRQPRSRYRRGQPRDGPPARTGLAPRQRCGALCRAGARAPVLRPVRPVDRRARGGAPPRSPRPDQRRADGDDDRRHPAAAVDGAILDRRQRRRGHPGHRPRARRTPGRGEAAAGGDGAGLEPAGASDLEGLPRSMARPSARRHANRTGGVGQPEDHGRP